MQVCEKDKATHRIYSTDGNTVVYCKGDDVQVMANVQDRNVEAARLGITARYGWEVVGN